GYRVVVRDYGLLIAPVDKLPPNAVTLADFLKSKPAAETVAKNETPVEGKVTQVDGKLMTLSIGADAGLALGDTLEAFRTDGKPAFLGTLKVVEVTPTASVAEAVGKLSAAVKVGDKVVKGKIAR